MSAATMEISGVSFAAQNLIKFCDDPGPVHWQAAMKALQYFWQTKNLGVTYGEVTSRDVVMSALRQLRSGNMPGQPTFCLR